MKTSANRVEEVRWDVTVNNQELKILDRDMEEIVRMYLFQKKLCVVDTQGNPVKLKGTVFI